MALSKHHQTLLVADGESSRSDYLNRIARLKESVNGSNIKADIVSSTKHGLVGQHDESPAYVETDVVSRFATALAEAKAAGYNQLVFSADPQAS